MRFTSFNPNRRVSLYSSAFLSFLRATSRFPLREANGERSSCVTFEEKFSWKVKTSAMGFMAWRTKYLLTKYDTTNMIGSISITRLQKFLSYPTNSVSANDTLPAYLSLIGIYDTKKRWPPYFSVLYSCLPEKAAASIWRSTGRSKLRNLNVPLTISPSLL